MRLFIIFCIASIILAIIYLCFRVLGGFMLGYSWKEMDWNQDGKTTLAEVVDARDIGRRDVVIGGKTCIEYFAFKDGLAVRIDCPVD